MIELRNVSKLFGKEAAVSGVSIAIPEGAIFGFLGQNGAGKTTTMKMLVGLSEPSEGEIRIHGADVRDSRVREHIGFMPESPYFYDKLTGMEFLKFCGSLFEHHTDNIGGLFAKVGLAGAENKAIGAYSKGMKQRLGFAQAIVNDPSHIFLDEPLDGLDPVGRRDMKVFMRELKAAGKTIFFNSHILFDLEEICDQIGVIHRGKLLYAGPVKEFTGAESLEERFVQMVEEQKTIEKHAIH